MKRTGECRGCGAVFTTDEALHSVCPRCLIGIALSDGYDDSSEVLALADPAAAIGDTIGPYEIIEVLGEGGMGIVYLADQREPIQRQVALKLIKLGMDTREVITRFESERRALALMDHPNIAKVHEAGVTPQGRSYFVMEYVPGVPVTQYCDERKLALHDRLRLFVESCRAIQHAHQRGIIHRDIKPSNILVAEADGRPSAKVIDFGVAKAIATPGVERTLFTRQGVLIGTPEYMSPEQMDAGGDQVDTRTDVYALGLTLYELLVGTLPLDRARLRRMSLEEIRACIRSEELLRPSERVETTPERAQFAGNRGMDPGALRRELRGDLDWVVMTALAKDPARRYGSPNELAADVERHLAHQPVTAGPPTRAYRLRKFVRRHRVGVAFAAALFVLLVVFALGMALQAGRIARERDRANREAEAASQVSAFLIDLFEVSDPSEARGETIPAREILDRGAQKIESELTDRPEVQARMMTTMGTVYKKMGLFDDALPLLRRSQQIRSETLGANHPDTLRSMLEMGELLFSQGKLDEAEVVLRDAMLRSNESLGEDHPDSIAALADLAVIMHFSGRLDEAAELYTEALDRRTRVLGPDHLDTLETNNNMAALYASQGDLASAEPYIRASLEGRERTLGPEHPETLDSIINLGVVLQGLGRSEEALPYSRRAVEIGRRIRPDHPKTLVSINNLGKVLEQMGQLEEAEIYYAEALEALRRALGEDHSDTITTMGNLGDLYTRLSRYEEAEELMSAASAAARRALPHPNVVTGYTLSKYGRLLTAIERYEEAEAVLVEARDILIAAAGPDHLHTKTVEQRLAALHETSDGVK